MNDEDAALLELGRRYMNWRSWYDAPAAFAGPLVSADLQRACVEQENVVRAIRAAAKDSRP